MGFEKDKLVKLKQNSMLMSPTNDGVLGLQFAKTIVAHLHCIERKSQGTCTQKTMVPLTYVGGEKEPNKRQVNKR